MLTEIVNELIKGFPATYALLLSGVFIVFNLIMGTLMVKGKIFTPTEDSVYEKYNAFETRRFIGQFLISLGLSVAVLVLAAVCFPPFLSYIIVLGLILLLAGAFFCNIYLRTAKRFRNDKTK